MKVLVAMSGGVDSSVTAALMLEKGYQVTGATMKLWGGPSDSGCCSVSDVDDARRVANELGIVHHVFNFADDFEEKVVNPYVDSHAHGLVPNPCIECNRHIKFERFLKRAMQMGFDAVATGHYARIENKDGKYLLLRGKDPNKDQSYVLSMLDQPRLARTLLPIGEMHKDKVREKARQLGLRTANKPDSQDVCFINSKQGRQGFLSQHIKLNPGTLVDFETGEKIGDIDALELVTPGQRRKMGTGLAKQRHYAVSIDVESSQVKVGPLEAILVDKISIDSITWTDMPIPVGEQIQVQPSAHGQTFAASFEGQYLNLEQPHRVIAPGQTVAFYKDDQVIGAALVTRTK